MQTVIVHLLERLALCQALPLGVPKFIILWNSVHHFELGSHILDPIWHA